MKKMIRIVLFFAALVASAEDFRWKDPIGGNWNDTARWSTGVVPLGDGTENITVPASNTQYNISVNVDNVAIRGLTIESVYQTAGIGTQAIRFQTKELAIGEGGFQFSDAGLGYAAPRFSALRLTDSQTWDVDYQNNQWNQRVYFDGKVTAAEDVLWTIDGHNLVYPGTAATASSFLGQIRSNARIHLSVGGYDNLGTNQCFVWYPSDNASYASMIRLAVNSATNSIRTPIHFQLTNTTVSSYIYIAANVSTPRQHRVVFEGAWEGSLASNLLAIGRQSHDGSILGSLYPERERVVLANDNRGIVTNGLPSINIMEGAIEVASPHAFAENNVLPLHFGNGGTEDAVAGLYVNDGITVASPIVAVANAKRKYVPLGADGNAAVTFTGSITALKAGSTANACAVTLGAGAGGSATFTGNLSANGSCPVEIVAAGDVILSGDNRGLAASLSLRTGRLRLASATAAGDQPILLGGTVPTNYVVRALQDYATAATVVDNVALVEGDLIYRNSLIAVGASAAGFYRFTGGALVAASQGNVLRGSRILVQEGTLFGGKSFYNPFAVTSTSPRMYQEPKDGDVAVLTDGAVTIANSISVVNNLSAGRRIIGGATAEDASAFTGAIALAGDVAFSAVSGGVVTISGILTGTGNIEKIGAGAVALTGDSNNWQGESVTLTDGTLSMQSADLSGKSLAWNVTDGVTGVLAVEGGLALEGLSVAMSVTGGLDREQAYTLATATSTLSGKPDVTGIDDLQGWRLLVQGQTLKLVYVRPRTVLIIL